METPAEIAETRVGRAPLLARYNGAEAKFQHALEKDPGLIEARTGLAMLQLNRDPAAARREAKVAVAGRIPKRPGSFSPLRRLLWAKMKPLPWIMPGPHRSTRRPR